MAGEPEGMVVSKCQINIQYEIICYHMLENDEAVVIYDCLVVAAWPVLSLPLLWIPVLLLSDN